MFLKLSIDVLESPHGGFEPVIKISGLLDVVNGSDDVRDRLIKLFLEQHRDSLLSISYRNSADEAVIRRVKDSDAVKILKESYGGDVATSDE